MAKQQFFHRIGVKYTILTILPIIYSGSFSLFFYCQAKWHWVLTVFAFISSIVFNIIALRFYNSQEKNLQSTRALSRAYIAAKEVISDCASLLYQTVKSTKETHSEIQDWAWVKSECDRICATLYNLINEIAICGEHFAVNIIFKKIENNITGFTMLSIKSYRSNYPSLYGTFSSEDRSKNFHYKHLFDEQPSRPSFLFTKDEIDAVFRNVDGVNYSQYIGIPISCTGNKMFALLQILAYDDSKLASTKKELEALYDNYFCVFSSLTVLADKVENIKQIIKNKEAT